MSEHSPTTPASLAGTPEQTDAPGFTDPKFCHKLVGDEGRYVCRFPKGHDGECHPHLNARNVPEAFDYPAAARSLALNLAEFCDESLPYPQMVAEAGRRAAREIEQLRLVRAGSATPASSDVLTESAGKYRKKPVVIDAMQWDGSRASFEAIREWAAKMNTILLSDDEQYLVVATLEDGGGDAPQAVHTADMGDWIIRGVKGEFYPCKPDIFEATYDRA